MGHAQRNWAKRGVVEDKRGELTRHVASRAGTPRCTERPYQFRAVMADLNRPDDIPHESAARRAVVVEGPHEPGHWPGFSVADLGDGHVGLECAHRSGIDEVHVVAAVLPRPSERRLELPIIYAPHEL